MTDRRRRSVLSGRSTRRAFLAVAGATALAGCNGIGGDLLSDDPPELDGGELGRVPATDPPSVPETVPVEISRSHLDRGVARARDLLASVPAPFDAEEIPNGAIRKRLAERYERAEEGIASVEEAATPLEATSNLRQARVEAAGVAAGWRAIDGDLSKEDVRASARGVWDAVDRFRERWEYVGSDPVRALLVHEIIESRVGGATNWIENVSARRRTGRDDPLAVGEIAGDLEAARASLADARHLYERLRATSDDSRNLRAGFASAAETLSSRVRRRRDQFPDGNPDEPSSLVDGDVEGTPVGSAIREVAQELKYDDEFERSLDADRYATAVVSLYGTLVRVRAFESLRERVAADEHLTVEAADDAVVLRKRAVTAVQKVLDAEAHADLNREELADVAGLIEYADRELDGYDADDSVSVDWVVRDLGRYVRTAALAGGIPGASGTVARIVRESV